MKKKSKKSMEKILSEEVRKEEENSMPYLSIEEVHARMEWSNRFERGLQKYPFDIKPFQATALHIYSRWI
jgi:hypothetical protein